jgi:hypothetical protein
MPMRAASAIRIRSIYVAFADVHTDLRLLWTERELINKALRQPRTDRARSQRAIARHDSTIHDEARAQVGLARFVRPAAFLHRARCG